MNRRKLGKPLPPIEKVSPPAQEAIDLAILKWDAYAPAKYRGLLSARPFGTKDPKARWFYDARRMRYISKSGRVVSPKELREAYLAYNKALKNV